MKAKGFLRGAYKGEIQVELTLEQVAPGRVELTHSTRPTHGDVSSFLVLADCHEFVSDDPGLADSFCRVWDEVLVAGVPVQAEDI